MTFRGNEKRVKSVWTTNRHEDSRHEEKTKKCAWKSISSIPLCLIFLVRASAQNFATVVAAALVVQLERSKNEKFTFSGSN